MLISNNGKIDQVFKTHLQKTYGVKTKTDATEQKTDQVSISSRASEIQTVKQIAASAPDVRSDKVSALAGQIEDGSYSPSDEDIADAFFSDPESV